MLSKVYEYFVSILVVMIIGITPICLAEVPLPDSLYNPDKPCPAGFKRLALHAKSIEFEDLKGERVKVESKLPEEFSAGIL